MSPALCSENGNSYQSFSSQWIALVTVNGTQDDIYQVGFLKCQACGGFSSNTVYWVHAYGHESGTCGSAVHPSAVSDGVASVSSATFKIRRSTDVDNDPIYAASVGASVVDTVPASSLDTCWPNGPRQADFHLEVAQQNDQAAGTTANKQDWTGVKYEDSSLVWHSLNAPLGIGCTLAQLGTMGCTISTTAHDGLRMWDKRT